jgi:hypothetical protein
MRAFNKYSVELNYNIVIILSHIPIKTTKFSRKQKGVPSLTLKVEAVCSSVTLVMLLDFTTQKTTVSAAIAQKTCVTAYMCWL